MEKKFKAILQQYEQGSASIKEKEAIDSFVQQMNMDGIPLEEIQENQHLKNTLYRSILAHTSAKKRRVRKRKKTLLFSSFFLFIALGIFGYYTFSDFSQTYISTNTQQVITLTDQSKVTLFPGSKLIVSKAFNQADRRVHLKGKAFFEVSKNKQLAFTVVSTDLETSVLGTSFLVEEHLNATSIEVSTGKVKVQDKTHTDYVILQPHESARFENYKLQKYNAQNNRVSSWNQSLNMVNASFAHWKTSIEREFDIIILSKNKAIQHIKITGDYRNSNLQDILDSFCFINNLRYSNQNNLITINEAKTND